MRTFTSLEIRFEYVLVGKLPNRRIIRRKIRSCDSGITTTRPYVCKRTTTYGNTSGKVTDRLYYSLWQVSLVRQKTLTRPEHLVLPLLQCALMFERSTCYVLFTAFGTSMDYSFGQWMRICSY